MQPAARRRRRAQHPHIPGPSRQVPLSPEDYGRAICASKISYLTQQLANNASYLLGLRYPDEPPLRAYDCPWCPDWHLASVDDAE
jgi:hypothetical protein